MTNKYILKSKHKTITTLTLGTNKNQHIITKKDRFLDNGCGIHLLKELTMKVQYPGDSLRLEEADIKEIERFGYITHNKHEFLCHGTGLARVYSITHLDETFHVMGYKSQEDVDNKTGCPLGSHGYYENALTQKEENENNYLLVKIFDSELDVIDY